jgi:radical SAM superfamily enzyme YgiQ (UPF0313 family)
MKLTLIQLYHTFVEQGQIWYMRKRKMAYAPTTLTSLAACIPPELGFEIQLIDEGVDVVDPEKIDADVVGLSVMTPDAPRAYKMARYFRSRGIITILGGFHPTLMPAEAAENADAIVTGYAEKSFPALLTDLKNKRLKKIYDEPCDEVFCRSMPAPLRAKLQQNRYLLPDSIELTRGCNSNCDFCVIPNFCEKRYLKRDISQILKELELFRGKKITFLDSSPAEDIRYIKEFYRAIIHLNLTWYSCVSMKAADDEEWLELAAESGCKGVLIGFESLSEEAVKAEHKHFNQISKYSDFITRLHNKGIMVLGSFMFGFDNDGKDIFARTVEFVDRTHMDMVHYAVNTPFPGTTDFARLDKEDRILTRDWSLYDGTHVIYKPAGMTVEELQNGYYRAFKESHTLSSILRRTAGSKARSLTSLLGNVAFRQLSNVLVPPGFHCKASGF